MLKRFSIAAKSLGLSVVVLTLTACGQATLLARGWPTSAALAVPMGVAGAIATSWAFFLVRTRTRPLVEALQRIAGGSFDTRLPPAPDPEFVVIEDAFNAMGTALDGSLRELRHADAQRRRLFADLAHELATPTSSLIGIAEALAAGADEGQRAMLLGYLDSEGTRLERLVCDLRDLAHLDDPDFRVIPGDADLATIAEAAAAWAQASPSAGARVTCTTCPVAVRVDAQRIEQALHNLLGNALRYTPADGEVAIRVERDGPRARLTVDDSGAGIPDALLSSLGDRLLRIDPSRSRSTGGHGLGLSIVAAIVARHDGALSFGRSPLGGLRASIELPCRD